MDSTAHVHRFDGSTFCVLAITVLIVCPAAYAARSPFYEEAGQMRVMYDLAVGGGGSSGDRSESMAAFNNVTESVGGVELMAAVGTTVDSGGYLHAVGASSRWSAEVGQLPDVTAIEITSKATLREKMVLTASTLNVIVAWDGGYVFRERIGDLPIIWVELGAQGQYTYGYRLIATMYSDPNSVWLTHAGQGGQWADTMLSEDVLIDDFSDDSTADGSTFGQYNFFAEDIGQEFWLELTVETWISGSDFQVLGDGAMSNSVDFFNSLGATLMDGAEVVPEPASLVLLAACLPALRRRRR